MRREQPLLHRSDRLLLVLEAGQVLLAEDHHFDENDHLVGMLLESHEAELDQVAEQSIVLALNSSEHVDVLLRKLERSLLELKAFSGRVRQQESKVNVDDVAFRVDHDVAVVPIFDRQDVLREAVSGQ